MMAFVTKMIFAARGDDVENWMQILIVVIMAVIYGLGGILKAAKSKKLDDKDQRQGSRTRPAGAVTRRVYEAYQAYQAASQPKRPEAAPAKMVLQKPAKAKIQEVPEVMPEIEKLPEFIGETTKGLEQEHKEARAVVYLGQPLLDVSDPEAIRRAILHYEIFGKPLSLREP